jgi:hypothetical protein
MVEKREDLPCMVEKREDLPCMVEKREDLPVPRRLIFTALQ